MSYYFPSSSIYLPGLNSPTPARVLTIVPTQTLRIKGIPEYTVWKRAQCYLQLGGIWGLCLAVSESSTMKPDDKRRAAMVVGHITSTFIVNHRTLRKEHPVIGHSGTWFSGGLLVRVVWSTCGWTRWSLRTFPTSAFLSFSDTICIFYFFFKKVPDTKT